MNLGRPPNARRPSRRSLILGKGGRGDPRKREGGKHGKEIHGTVLKREGEQEKTAQSHAQLRKLKDCKLQS